MTKRRSDGRNTGRYNPEDSPIDIDGAFRPTKGKQSVEYDVDDESIGLTQAFGAVSVEDEPKYGWDDDDKWTDFDWNASYRDEYAAVEHIDSDGAPLDADGEAEQAAGTSADTGDTGAAAQAAAGAGAAAASKTTSSSSTSSSKRSSSGRGRHAARDIEDTPRMQQSKRMRRGLIVLIVLLLIGLAVLGVFMFRTFTESQEQAAQQAQQQAADSDASIDATATDEAVQTATKQADVPNLSAILGLNVDDAIADIDRGAKVTSEGESDDEDSAIKYNMTVSLTSEPADSRTGGTPTVYLGLDEDDKVIQAGYSASASALGFGSLSFSDAVTHEHVIEKTLAKIGVDVEEGVAVLPDDKDEYSTYAADGTTVVKERCAFEGEAEIDGDPCVWSAVLSYDYATQVLTGNLSDTVRVIYVYVTLD